jgi:methylated-DNA-[protein]-cysteine S-methyltransferase
MAYYTRLESPIGELLLVGDGAALTGLYTEQEYAPNRELPGLVRDDTLFAEAASQLDAYFAGELQDFNLPLAPRGTPFQQTVWSALREIPFSETRSYGEIARKIGAPTACRAVGMANGCNPISIIIPCHRVIGADGSLTGYGGGIERKRWLLNHEGAGRASTVKQQRLPLASSHAETR